MINIIIAILLLFSITLFTLHINYNKERFTTFTRTQKWKQSLLNYALNIDEERKQIAEYILTLDIQPKFNKEQEIEDLIYLQNLRSQDDVQHILNQREIDGMLKYFNVNKQDYMELFKLTKYIQPIIYYLKKHFNRIRPSYLDKRIKPSLIVPLHPSYPSGHSMQSYITAFYLSYKYPKDKSKFMTIAHNVAKNRELGGVHYRSDTIYGKNASKIIFDYLIQNNKLEQIIS